MVSVIATEENTPHSPKSIGKYKRDNIGVTTIGSRNMTKLLLDIFIVFSNSELSLIFFIMFLKTYIFLARVRSTW